MAMIEHLVRVQRPGERLQVHDQLAWKLAALAADDAPVDDDVRTMIENRLIDNASVALASLTRAPVVHARAQALLHPRPGGAVLFGCAPEQTTHAEWAAWANGVAVRELDYHDTFLAAEYSHPGDNIPPLLAVAQQTGASGQDLVRAIATAYEVQVDLSKAISLHEHAIDHVAHLGPSVAAGLGTLLGLSVETIYQAIQQALHTTTATRQSRKGAISSWKSFAPAFAGKVSIEAVDRAMRGEGSPSPIYEGEDGVLAQLLDGPDSSYVVPLPAPGEAKRAILETYTKEHSAEYQAQAFVDLARRLRSTIGDLSKVRAIHIATSHHTHVVIGTGANDPEKLDPRASRETLDHSLMYLFAVALEDGEIDHERSYLTERAQRPSTIALWHAITTSEDPTWTRRYHSNDLKEQAFGGHVRVELADGRIIEDEMAVADAHPLGARPFGRVEYVAKFSRLSEPMISNEERDRFLEAVGAVSALSGNELAQLNPVATSDVAAATPLVGGIF